jgi:hypothetical protein
MDLSLCLFILFYYLILSFVASLPAPYQLCGGSLGVDYAPLLMRLAVLCRGCCSQVAAHYNSRQCESFILRFP